MLIWTESLTINMCKVIIEDAILLVEEQANQMYELHHRIILLTGFDREADVAQDNHSLNDAAERT